MAHKKSSTRDIEFVVGSTEEYRSREFCRGVRCTVQTELDRHEKGSDIYDHIKTRCENRCAHSSVSFMSWLAEHRYHVVGETGETPEGQETAYEYHRRLQQTGCRIVRNRDE